MVYCFLTLEAALLYRLWAGSKQDHFSSDATPHIDPNHKILIQKLLFTIYANIFNTAKNGPVCPDGCKLITFSMFPEQIFAEYLHQDIAT